MKHVAERAGVSIGTVSNVLNRPDVVAGPTRDRVLAVIDEVGFVRNGWASKLRSSQSRTFGLVILDIGNPFFARVARGVEDVADELGYTVMVCNSDCRPVREARHLDFLQEHRVAGLLITPTDPAAVATKLELLQERGMTAVLVDEPSQRGDQCSVAVDDLLGGQIAGRHLLALGRRRIVFVTVVGAFRQFEERLAGLQQEVAHHPNADDIEILVVRLPTLDAVAGHAGVSEILGHRPDAVFCANDIVALGVLRGLLEAGVKVPGTIALMGYDDIDFAAIATIPLTSIRQPAYDLGRTAATMLLEECAGQDHSHRHVMFQPELVVRRSTQAKAIIGQVTATVA
jgi:LacI family transcriptional regulator